MSILVVGISHKSAPVELLDRLALDTEGVPKLVAEANELEHVTEAAVISTCNRLEIYAAVTRFHGSVERLSSLLVERAEESTEALVPHLYVHYDDAAVSHLFHVAAGLDSMALGEGQILGQTREALRVGQDLGTVGPALNSLFQQALRVGKRAHAETDIDRAAPSLVSAALALAQEKSEALAGQRVLVVGAGSMASLAMAHAVEAGAGELIVVNRTEERAARLAASYGASSGPISDLGLHLQQVDAVITCTGAADILITHDVLPDRPITLIDLALPHDVDPAVADQPHVTLVNIAQLAEVLEGSQGGREVAEVKDIVASEVAAYLNARREIAVTPTVVALRSMASTVVDTELARLDARLPDLPADVRAELHQAVRRVSDKLIHQPTTRVKMLADSSKAVSYTAALAELFALDPEAVDAVTRPGGAS